MRRGIRIALVLALWLAGAAAPAAAQSGRVRVGPRFNVSDDADLGVGADVRWPFLPADRRLALTASFDWFFPDDSGLVFPDVDLFLVDVSYWEANLNLTYDFGTTGAVTPYAGVGVNYAHRVVSVGGVLDFETEDDDVGANVLAGVRFGGHFYVEAKKEAGGGDLFVVSAGVRF